jgi:RNA polymerase sigma factor (sigma-70 family)
MSCQLKDGRANQPSTTGWLSLPSITEKRGLVIRHISTTKTERTQKDISELSNEELIQACHQGDSLAWEALIGRYQRLVYSIPRRAGLGEDGAAEVFQRVFEKLVKYLDQIEQPERLGAWLATTARRETLHLSQRERSTQLLINDDDTEEEINQLPCEALLPEEILLRSEEQHMVRMAVAALDERSRCLLNLLFYRSDPPPYAEVAMALDMPEGSIGPTRARCLQKLRRLLDDVGFYCIFGLDCALSFSRIMMDSLPQL